MSTATILRSSHSSTEPSRRTCRQPRGRGTFTLRRELRYDPDLDYSNPEVYRASSVLEAGGGYCVGKAALFAALCRAGNIPARVAFADRSEEHTSELQSHL